MKKLLTTITVLIIASSAAFANNEALTPSVVKSAFETKFGKTIDVQWEIVHNVYIGRFTSNGNNVEVYFSENGEFLGSARYVTQSWLPQLISGKLKDRFPCSSLTQVLEFTSETNGTSYYVSLTTGKDDLVLRASTDGEINIISKTKK